MASLRPAKVTVQSRAGGSVGLDGFSFSCKCSQEMSFFSKSNTGLVSARTAHCNTFGASSAICPDVLVAGVFALTCRPKIRAAVIQAIHVNMVNAAPIWEPEDKPMKHNGALLSIHVLGSYSLSINIFDSAILPSINVRGPTKIRNKMHVIGGDNSNIPLRKWDKGVIARNKNSARFFGQGSSPLMINLNALCGRLQQIGGLS